MIDDKQSPHRRGDRWESHSMGGIAARASARPASRISSGTVNTTPQGRKGGPSRSATRTKGFLAARMSRDGPATSRCSPPPKAARSTSCSSMI